MGNMLCESQECCHAYKGDRRKLSLKYALDSMCSLCMFCHFDLSFIFQRAVNALNMLVA